MWKAFAANLGLEYQERFQTVRTILRSQESRQKLVSARNVRVLMARWFWGACWAHGGTM